MSKGTQAGAAGASQGGLPNVLPYLAPSLAKPSASDIGAQIMQSIAKNPQKVDLSKIIPQLQQMQDAAKASAPQPLVQPQQPTTSVRPPTLPMMLPYFMPRSKP